MVKNKYQKNINLLIIFSIFLFLLPICYNKQIIEHNKNRNEIHSPSDGKADVQIEKQMTLKEELIFRKN